MTDRVPSAETHSRRAWPAAVGAVLAFAVPALAVWWGGLERSAQQYDEQVYHWPTIVRYAAEWPAFDFQTSTTAMTPGYHLLAAAVVRAGGGLGAVRLMTIGITAGLVAAVAAYAARRRGPLDGFLLALPLAWSPYVFTAGVYAVPHNLAWLGVWAVLMAVGGRHQNVLRCAVAGALLAALVWVRQVHVWALLPMLVAARRGPAGEGAGAGRRVATMIACSIPALASLAWFVRLWGGLAPKTQSWAQPAGGVNVAAVVMMLATIAVLGTAYAVWLVGRDRRPVRKIVGVLLLAGVVGLIIGLVRPTDYNQDAGRWSGLWHLTRLTPVWGHRSPLIVLMAAWGAAVVAWAVVATPPRFRWVVAAVLIGFAAAHAAIGQAWQRYYEPMVLMTAVWLVGLVAGERSGREPAWPRAARGLIALLAAGQAVVTISQFRG